MSRLAALLLLVGGANALQSAVAPGAPAAGTSKDYNRVPTTDIALSDETNGGCDFIMSEAWCATHPKTVFVSAKEE